MNSVFCLMQRNPASLTGKMQLVGKSMYMTKSEAFFAADEIELETGRRVAIDEVLPNGTARRVRGPEDEE